MNSTVLALLLLSGLNALPGKPPQQGYRIMNLNAPAVAAKVRHADPQLAEPGWSRSSPRRVMLAKE